MADIELRFHKDMLVLSSPLDAVLERQGVMPEDKEFIVLMEPETIHDALRLEVIAGAQCLVTHTEGVCESRLAHSRFEDRQDEYAQNGLGVVRECKPQHAICEIGPCGLPLDWTCEPSVKQVRAQYADAVRAFNDETVDAFLFLGINDVHDMRCALEGAREVTNRPLFACFNVDEDGKLRGRTIALEEAVAELGDLADVYGFSCGAGPDALCSIAQRTTQVTDAPLMAQIEIKKATEPERRRAALGGPIPGNPYPVADGLVDAATRLRGAGVQFLRAAGEATPAYTGALVVASAGFDCVR